MTQGKLLSLFPSLEEMDNKSIYVEGRCQDYMRQRQEGLSSAMGRVF